MLRKVPENAESVRADFVEPDFHYRGVIHCKARPGYLSSLVDANGSNLDVLRGERRGHVEVRKKTTVFNVWVRLFAASPI